MSSTREAAIERLLFLLEMKLGEKIVGCEEDRELEKGWMESWVSEKAKAGSGEKVIQQD